MAYQQMTLGSWDPPATPSYPGAAGPGEPANNTLRLVRLMMLRDLGSWGSGEQELADAITQGKMTAAQVGDWIRTWRSNNPANDNRQTFPALVSWAAAQLNGDALKQMSPGGSSASTSTTGGSSGFTMTPLAWLGVAAAALALLGRRRR